MGKGVISLMLAVGAATWLYTRFQRTSGNNTARSVKAAAIAAIVIFIFSFIVLGLFL